MAECLESVPHSLDVSGGCEPLCHHFLSLPFSSLLSPVLSLTVTTAFSFMTVHLRILNGKN